jgi:hypothetical protein
MTCWIATDFGSSRVEVGRDCHRFYCGFAENSIRTRFHLGDSASTENSSSLYTYQDHLLRIKAGRVVYVKDSMSVWSAEEDCV